MNKIKKMGIFLWEIAMTLKFNFSSHLLNITILNSNFDIRDKDDYFIYLNFSKFNCQFFCKWVERKRNF